MLVKIQRKLTFRASRGQKDPFLFIDFWKFPKLAFQNAQNFQKKTSCFKQPSTNPFHWCITLDSTPNTVEVMAGATFDQKIGPWTLKKLKKRAKTRGFGQMVRLG